MNPWDWVAFLIIAVFVGWWWQRSSKRVTELRGLAETKGLKYLGDTLPGSLPIGDLSPRVTSVWNVLDGERGGRRVVAFDCRFGQGKGSWCRTVIAIRAERSSVKASAFDPEIQVEQIGEWTILYRPREVELVTQQLTPVTELAAYLDAI